MTEATSTQLEKKLSPQAGSIKKYFRSDVQFKFQFNKLKLTK